MEETIHAQSGICGTNLESDLHIIIQVPKKTCPLLWVQNPKNRQIMIITNSEAARTYPWPELNVVRHDHPVLQFHLKSTQCSEVLQNLRERLPFPLTVQTLVKASLERYHHGHNTAAVSDAAVWFG